MKKILSIITITATIAVVMAACTRNPLATAEVSYTDSIGFAQFQQWKAMNERLETNQELVSKARARKSSSVNQSGSMTSESTNNAKTTKKKGWSKAAKYSAIGGGTGIILGAVINKRNPVKGGIIGGILGGGLGFGIGRSKDTKEGRY